MNNYQVTIGIEVHAQLNTKRKIFSPAFNNMHDTPNKNVHPIDLALPGTLPIFNEEVLEKAILIASAFNMNITHEMSWDRKNYFYHDNPKGYQVTQYRTPIGTKGSIVLDNNKYIGVAFMHMEEDTAKSNHKEDKTYLDYNRAGIPLVEIVSEPDISNKEEAKVYLEKLREILLYLNVSDCKMEDGSLRVDVNVSIRPVGQEKLNTKVEIKNLNSFSNVQKAIDLEIADQTLKYNTGKEVLECTKRYLESSNSLELMRLKDGTDTYRFIPEPELSPISINEEYINDKLTNMPLLPSQIVEKLKSLRIPEDDIVNLMKDKDMTLFYLELIKEDIDPIFVINNLLGSIKDYLNQKSINFNNLQISNKHFIDLWTKFNAEVINSGHVKKILAIVCDTNQEVQDIIDQHNLKQLSDASEIRTIILKVLNANEKIINDYNSGNERALKSLMGQVMKESKGLANPKIVNENLKEELEKRK